MTCMYVYMYIREYMEERYILCVRQEEISSNMYNFALVTNSGALKLFQGAKTRRESKIPCFCEGCFDNSSNHASCLTLVDNSLKLPLFSSRLHCYVIRS